MNSAPQSMLETTKLELVSSVVAQLQRTLKTICLYPPSNSACVTARKRFTHDLLDALLTLKDFTLQVESGFFTYSGERLRTSVGVEERLASLCFESGVTELRFNSELNEIGIELLLDIFRKASSRTSGADNLVEALWGEKIEGFSYEVLEDFTYIDYDEIKSRYFGEEQNQSAEEKTDRYDQIFVEPEISSSGGNDLGYDSDFSAVVEGTIDLLSDDPEGESQDRTDLPSQREIVQQAYELNEEESLQVEQELLKDLNFDDETEALNLLADLLDQEGHLSEFSDTIAACSRMHTHFIEIAELASAGTIVEMLDAAGKEHKKQHPQRERKVTEAVSAIGSRERLQLLAQTLNENPELNGEKLKDYLRRLNWTAYSALADLLGELDHQEHRMALCDALSRVDKSHVDLIASGIYDRRWYVVRNSAMILSRFNQPSAHRHLEKALGHSDALVRIEVVRGCQNHDPKYVNHVILLSIDDKSSQIQQVAMAIALRQEGPQAFKMFSTMISSTKFPDYNSSTQGKILFAYSLSGGKRAVALLTRMASRWHMFGGEQDTNEVRLALSALSRNNSPEAHAALKKLAANWRPKLKTMAREALKKVHSHKQNFTDRPSALQGKDSVRGGNQDV